MEFEWDEHNRNKNKIKHKVDYLEAEEVFFNNPLLVLEDRIHSQKEKRYIAFGKTDRGRLLMLVFTVRNSKIRIISARDQDKKERTHYQLHSERYEKT